MSPAHGTPAPPQMPACWLGPPSRDCTLQARAGSAPTPHTWTMTRAPRTVIDRSQLPPSETSLSLPHARWSPPKSAPQQEGCWAPHVRWSVSLRGPSSRMGVSLPRGGHSLVVGEGPWDYSPLPNSGAFQPLEGQQNPPPPSSAGRPQAGQAPGQDQRQPEWHQAPRPRHQ